MQKTIELYGKPIQVSLSQAAKTAAEKLSSPLLAEIHLIMGCLIIKRVNFNPGHHHSEERNIYHHLNLCFRVVRYPKHCSISHIDSGEEAPEDYPLVADKQRFVPRWLTIDYKKGNWVGEYGLA